MPDPSTEVLDIDARLAQIDRGLRELQALLMLEREPDSRPPTAQEGDTALRLGAGPFASVEAVRKFERTLESIPGVREVTISGYEGAARAIFDVQLS